MLRPSRIALIHGSLLLFALALIARAAVVQLWQHDAWTARADRQHYAPTTVPAPRGEILDAGGVPLAQSREVVRVSIAPRELRDRRATARALAGMRVDRDWIARATDPRRAWVALPGSYLPSDAAALVRMRGVYAQASIERLYSQREATRHVIGSVDANGAPVSGLELTLDSLLQGRAGKALLVRDSRGARLESPLDTAVAPQPGDAVVLTINQELQEISERALASAIADHGADGGDIVVVDPSDGEIRAMASLRADATVFGSPALSEPFEPGSTMKPLIASRLLALGRAKPDEVVNTENGSYTIEGRTIRDDHPAARLSLADVIRLSSNIGIVKFASRLSPREEFETLRDFGFGTPTGVPFPGEAAGVLRAPAQWSKQSPASLAMGYEVSVTPLQLVAAYTALANGGELLEPALVKEIRAPDGTVKYRHTRRVVRRVMSPEVARTVRSLLVGVVEGGTGREAQLRNFSLAGKSGTSRRTVGRHGYAAGHYTASFVALFPAEQPQYVILVKLDNPKGEFLAAKTAAPISKIVLQAALAARDAALNRGALAASESLATRRDDSSRDTTPASPPEAPVVAAAEAPRPVVVTLPRRAPRAAPATPRPVPEVKGLTVRAAVLALHHAGFRVQLAGLGTAEGTQPEAGQLAKQGTLVRLVTTP